MKKIMILLNAALIILFFSPETFSQNIGEDGYIYINNIFLPFDNAGNIADVYIPGYYSGGYYQDHEFLFSAGFWLSGYTNDSLWANGVAPSGLVKDYQPGTVGMDTANTLASLYRLNSTDVPFGQSWQEWGDAVALGAKFYDGDGDGVYNPVDLNNNGVWDPDEDKPDIIGDETFWCVYNDGVPAEHRRWLGEPQGIEIRQTIFAFATSSQTLGNVVFVRYRIKNTGNIADTLKDVYFCHFADADIGELSGYSQNFVGCDTLRNASYTYLKNPSPDDWGDNPPCFLTDLLTGPMAYIPGVSFEDINNNNIYDEGVDVPLDTAYSYQGPLGVPIYPGAMNQKMTSAEYIINSDPVLREPNNQPEARNEMLGLMSSGAIVDPCNWIYGQVTGGVPCDEVNPYYWGSGDPVQQLGWISTLPNDVRDIQTSGPFQLVKNKEIEILVAYEVGRGTSALNSVTVAKGISDEIQSLYENNFDYPYVLGVNDFQNDKLDFSLSQNYPNPFNPATRIGYTIPKDGFVTMEVFNVLGQKVSTLVNKFQQANQYEVNFNGSSLASGIYIYRMRVNNFISTKKMILIK